MRGDEQAAAFGPQTLKQREDAGVRSALGEGAAKIEVTECGHMPGVFVSSASGQTSRKYLSSGGPMMESSIRGTGSPASRRTAAMASRTSGALSQACRQGQREWSRKGTRKAASKTPCNVHRKSRKPRHMRAYTGKRVPSYGCALPQVNLCGASAVSVVARPRPLGQACGTC